MIRVIVYKIFLNLIIFEYIKDGRFGYFLFLVVSEIVGFWIIGFNFFFFNRWSDLKIVYSI